MGDLITLFEIISKYALQAAVSHHGNKEQQTNDFIIMVLSSY